MKIFNWVHRRFTHKDGLGEAAKKMSGYDDDGDEQFVHENINNAFPNMFDDWKGGVLTIGTFGYDPLKDDVASFYDQEQVENEVFVDHQLVTDSEEEFEDHEEVEQVKLPLMLAAYEHDYEGLMEMKMEGNRVSQKDEFGGILAKKERRTLAELFYADSEEVQKKPPIISKGELMIKEIQKSNYKNGFSFTKKLIGDQDGRPIHKLHRLVRRMLKRKIHPDVGVRVAAKKCTESASLLSTQDATVKLDG